MDPRDKGLAPNTMSTTGGTARGTAGVRYPGPAGVNYGYDPRTGQAAPSGYHAGVAGHRMAVEAEVIAEQAAAARRAEASAANAVRREEQARINAQRRAAAAAANAARREDQARINAAAAARRAEINGIAMGRFEQRYPRNATGARPGLPPAPRRQSKSGEEFALHQIRQAVEAEMQPAAAAPAAQPGFFTRLFSKIPGFRGGKRTKRRSKRSKKSRRLRR